MINIHLLYVSSSISTLIIGTRRAQQVWIFITNTISACLKECASGCSSKTGWVIQWGRLTGCNLFCTSSKTYHNKYFVYVAHAWDSQMSHWHCTALAETWFMNADEYMDGWSAAERNNLIQCNYHQRGYVLFFPGLFDPPCLSTQATPIFHLFYFYYHFYFSTILMFFENYTSKGFIYISPDSVCNILGGGKRNPLLPLAWVCRQRWGSLV